MRTTKRAINFLFISIFLFVGTVVADTVIQIKPEMSLGPDGKATITNARQLRECANVRVQNMHGFEWRIL